VLVRGGEGVSLGREPLDGIADSLCRLWVQRADDLVNVHAIGPRAECPERLPEQNSLLIHPDNREIAHVDNLGLQGREATVVDHHRHRARASRHACEASRERRNVSSVRDGPVRAGRGSGHHRGRGRATGVEEVDLDDLEQVERQLVEVDDGSHVVDLHAPLVLERADL